MFFWINNMDIFIFKMFLLKIKLAHIINCNIFFCTDDYLFSFAQYFKIYYLLFSQQLNDEYTFVSKSRSLQILSELKNNLKKYIYTFGVLRCRKTLSRKLKFLFHQRYNKSNLFLSKHFLLMKYFKRM